MFSVNWGCLGQGVLLCLPPSLPVLITNPAEKKTKQKMLTMQHAARQWTSEACDWPVSTPPILNYNKAGIPADSRLEAGLICCSSTANWASTLPLMQGGATQGARSLPALIHIHNTELFLYSLQVAVSVCGIKQPAWLSGCFEQTKRWRSQEKRGKMLNPRGLNQATWALWPRWAHL